LVIPNRIKSIQAILEAVDFPSEMGNDIAKKHLELVLEEDKQFPVVVKVGNEDVLFLVLELLEQGFLSVEEDHPDKSEFLILSFLKVSLNNSRTTTLLNFEISSRSIVLRSFRSQTPNSTHALRYGINSGHSEALSSSSTISLTPTAFQSFSAKEAMHCSLRSPW
jgi:hypothetical protein